MEKDEKFKIVGLAPNNKLPDESSNPEKKAETPGNKTPSKKRKKKKNQGQGQGQGQKILRNLEHTYGFRRGRKSIFTKDGEISASERLVYYVKGNNETGFNRVLKSYSDLEDEIRVASDAIIICAENRDLDLLKKVVNKFIKHFKNLIIEIISNAIASCAKQDKNEKLKIIVENACPRKQKKEILSNAKEICRKDGDDEAIQKINAHDIDFDTTLKLVESRTNWLITFAKEKSNKGIKELLKNTKEKQLSVVEIFSNAIVTCAKKGDKKTLKRIIRACPKELKTEIVDNAIAICKKDTELIATMNIKKASTSWIKRLVNKIFRNYNKNNGNNIESKTPNNNEDSSDCNSVTNITSVTGNEEDSILVEETKATMPAVESGTENPKETNPSNKTIDYFSNRKKNVAEITELSDEDEAKINEFVKEIVDSIQVNNITSLNKVISDCPVYLKEKVFAKVMVILKEKNIDTSSPSLEKFYAHNLVFSAVNNNEIAFNEIKDACPNKLQEIMFADAMLIYEDIKLPEKAKNASDFKKNMSVLQEDASISKESLLFFEDNTSVFSTINTLPSPLVGIIYAHNLVFSAINDDEATFNNIINACPDKLKEIMFTEAKAKCKGMKNEKKIIGKINGAYLEYHSEILTNKMKNQQQQNNDNFSDDESVTSQTTKHSEEDGIKGFYELCDEIHKISDKFNGEESSLNYKKQSEKQKKETPAINSSNGSNKKGKIDRKTRTSFSRQASF